MKKVNRSFRQNVPLLFACSGGSKAGELADLAARELAKGGGIVMSCPTAVAARIDGYLKKLRRDKRVIVLDGCDEDCVARTLQNSGFKGFMHIKLGELGLNKENATTDARTVKRVVEHVRGALKKRTAWKENAFSYHHSRDLFKKRG